MPNAPAPKRKGKPAKPAAPAAVVKAKAVPKAFQKAKEGRPSKYQPRFCDIVVQVGQRGGSMVAMAEACDAMRVNLYDWAEQHPEFSSALVRAKQAEQIFWENMGLQGLHADRFNAMVWKTSMQARFREDYTERKVQEVTGKDGGAIQTEVKTTIDATALAPEARAALRAALKAAKDNE